MLLFIRSGWQELKVMYRDLLAAAESAPLQLIFHKRPVCNKGRFVPVTHKKIGSLTVRSNCLLCHLLNLDAGLTGVKSNT